MPLVLLPFVLLGGILFAVLITPWTILQRYRAGTARRVARGWVALINVFGLAVSAGLFLVTAAITSVWIPGALSSSAWGLAGGSVIGLLGLVLTRWDEGPRTLHYTPNRWLVLAITATVALRLCIGIVRGWRAWQASPPDGSWLAESGLAGSMAAGAFVLGYYFVFWAGLWIRIRAHSHRRR